MVAVLEWMFYGLLGNIGQYWKAGNLEWGEIGETLMGANLHWIPESQWGKSCTDKGIWFYRSIFGKLTNCVRLFTQFRRSITITCLIMLLCGVFSGGHFLIVPCVFLLLIFCCSYVLLILFVLSSCCFHFFFFSIFCWSWYSQLHWELTLSLHNSRKDYWKGLKAIKASEWQIYLSLRWKEEEKWRWRTRRLLRRRSRRVCRRRGWHPPAAVPRLARDGCLTFSSHPLFPSTGSSDSFPRLPTISSCKAF